MRARRGGGLHHDREKWISGLISRVPVEQRKTECLLHLSIKSGLRCSVIIDERGHTSKQGNLPTLI